MFCSKYRIEVDFLGFELWGACFWFMIFMTKCHNFEKLFFPDFMGLLS